MQSLVFLTYLFQKLSKARLPGKGRVKKISSRVSPTTPYYGRGVGTRGKGGAGFLGTFPQSPGTVSPLRTASHSAIFCACVCESKILKMFYLFKKVR